LTSQFGCYLLKSFVARFSFQTIFSGIFKRLIRPNFSHRTTQICRLYSRRDFRDVETKRGKWS